jgi:hypothetical protein
VYPPRGPSPDLAGPRDRRLARFRTGALSATASMSTGYRAVQWNRQKIVYDVVMLGGVAL